jgi:hypothetical protein
MFQNRVLLERALRAAVLLAVLAALSGPASAAHGVFYRRTAQPTCEIWQVYDNEELVRLFVAPKSLALGPTLPNGDIVQYAVSSQVGVSRWNYYINGSKTMTFDLPTNAHLLGFDGGTPIHYVIIPEVYTQHWRIYAFDDVVGELQAPKAFRLGGLQDGLISFFTMTPQPEYHQYEFFAYNLAGRLVGHTSTQAPPPKYSVFFGGMWHEYGLFYKRTIVYGAYVYTFYRNQARYGEITMPSSVPFVGYDGWHPLFYSSSAEGQNTLYDFREIGAPPTVCEVNRRALLVGLFTDAGDVEFAESDSGFGEWNPDEIGIEE